ncbi:MAG: DUF3082 domain-containing protein [Leptolyngbyaceae cyanobacterium bins.59]|nr:DUF3082 domain-containing protein [Leptolyngbyaceae cyanobacterium bins.59]
MGGPNGSNQYSIDRLCLKLEGGLGSQQPIPLPLHFFSSHLFLLLSLTSMTPTPTPTPESKPATSPLRCFGGSLVAGGIAVLFYFLTKSIALAFALRPISFDNRITYNIAVAFRTLIVGMSTMGTGVFGLAAVGLMGLGIQLVIQKFTAKSDSSS